MAAEVPTEDARPFYPLVNAHEQEAARLGHLQSLSDPITIRWLEQLGVAPGWRCAELGAGAGSIAGWLADRVGPDGSVTAVDQDTSQLSSLAARPNVTVVEADLCELELPPASFDLVHSRAVLMHLGCPDEVVRRSVTALRPGGAVLFEESDGTPALEVADPPGPYERVMLPIARRWTWATGLAASLEALGLTDVRDDVRADPLVGGSPVAAFWQRTLASVARLPGMDEDAVAEMSALLDDPGFRLPFAARHRVTGRKPI